MILYKQPSEINQIARDYENQIKQLKDTLYRIGWHMRGSLTFNDLFNVISFEDRQILSEIIKENIETTNKTGLAIL